MSDRRSSGLPAAAVDITAYRSAVERAASSASDRPTVRNAGLVVAILLLVVTVVLAILAPQNRVALAAGAIGVVIAFAVVIGAGMASAQRRRSAVDEVATELDRTVARVTGHLASIGYVVDAETALDWVSTPESTATVPLVHDSVIAARWWRPAADDVRVFVEAYLRQDGTESTLPPLAPL